MQRFIFRSILADENNEELRSLVLNRSAFVKARVDGGFLMTLSLFKLKRNLFLYYECTDEYIEPEAIFPGLNPLLVERAEDGGDLIWIPMADIFHFSRPVSVEHWRRQKPVQRRVGMATRIRPEMLSRYIFYHYALQEEQPSIVNKYCMIGLDGNLIFYYEEQPVTNELPQYKGCLSTHIIPADWQDTWQELMEPHFLIWDDAPEDDKRLRPCEPLLEC